VNFWGSNQSTHRIFQLVSCVGLIVTVLSSLSLAASRQQSMPVRGLVPNNCSFIAAPSLNFLSYDPNGANNTVPLDQTTILQVSCTKGAIATIGIDSGANAGRASAGTRSLANGGRFLGYDVYRDAARTVLWTNAGAGLYTYISPSSLPANVSIYGRIFAGQNVPTGIYTDVLLVTINY
jgi:spore coat protein U-like protein